jgi:two-component system, CitB family, sensor kinase
VRCTPGPTPTPRSTQPFPHSADHARQTDAVPHLPLIRRPLRRHGRLRRSVVALQTWLLLLFLLALALAALTAARASVQDQARDTVLGVARTVAVSPFVVAASTTPDAPARLQASADSVRRANGVDFVVIMAPDRTRWTHPDPTKVGKPFVGDVEPALHGTAFTETLSGSTGSSVRAVAPVRDSDGRIVALVAVGDGVGSLWPVVAGSAHLLALLAILGAALAYAAPLLTRRSDRGGPPADSIGSSGSSGVSPPAGSAPAEAPLPRP